MGKQSIFMAKKVRDVEEELKQFWKIRNKCYIQEHPAGGVQVLYGSTSIISTDLSYGGQRGLYEICPRINKNH